jgi:hypothetical protein
MLNHVHELLGIIASVTRSTSDRVVKSVNRQKIVNRAKEDRVKLCRELDSESLYSALYGT